MKIKTALNVSLLLAALTCTAAANAADGWFVGGDLGQSRFTLKPPGGYSLSGTTQNATSTAYDLHVGYNFNRYVGVEAGYLDLGEYSISATQGSASARAKARASGVTLAALWKLPLNEQWSVFLRTGVLAGSAKTDLSISNPPDSASYSQTNYSGILPVLGVGATYAISKQWEVRAQYQDIGATKVAESAGTRIKLKDALWTLGVTYGF